jgi:cytochrome c oxidase cbb3-type subunit III
MYEGECDTTSAVQTTARRWAPVFLGLILASGALRASASAEATADKQNVTSDHPGSFSQTDIDVGIRIYNSQCAQCHGINGDQVSGIDLRRGQFRRIATADDLARTITNGVPGGGMPPFALTQAELTGILAFIRSNFDNMGAPVALGNAARGKALFEGTAGCAGCHRVNGSGSRVAPDLSDIGLGRTAAALRQSLLDPTPVMLPINRPVRIAMKDGRTLSGRRLNEDTLTVQIVDDKERLWSLAKSDIRSLVVEQKSTMPAYAGRLDDGELADMVAYLVSLRGLR